MNYAERKAKYEAAKAALGRLLSEREGTISKDRMFDEIARAYRLLIEATPDNRVGLAARSDGDAIERSAYNAARRRRA